MAELRDDDDAGPMTHLDNAEEVSTNVSEFAQVIFNNVQECYPPGNNLQCNYTLTPAIKPQSRDWIGVFKVGWTSTRQYRAFEWAPSPTGWVEGQEWNQDITFKAYYLPKEEDGEYYQLCYIDAAGKMRGASTPFQFLEQSADDFIQILDDSMDILMIHNKTEFCVEELKRVQEEKSELELEYNALKVKVVAVEAELEDTQKRLVNITKEYEARNDASESMEEQLRGLTEELTEAREKIAQLTEQAGSYESSLQQTEGAFMEVVNRELALRNKLDELEKGYDKVVAEKNSFKTKAETAKKNKMEMCEEIDSLKLMLSQSNETHQEIREREVRIKEQYQRIQQELQQTSVEKENFQMMESRFSSAESSRQLLSQELDSLKMVQDKLSKDLVVAKTEKESLRVFMDRQTKELKDEKRKSQLQAHQNREKQALLQEQISALKDGIQQLAQEKEMATKGTKGSAEAQQIAIKDLKDKVRRAQFQCKEEVRRRGDLQKKVLTMEASFREEKTSLMADVEDLRLRLQMAADEYKKIYTDMRQLQLKVEKQEKKKVQKELLIAQSTSPSMSSSNSSVSSSSSTSWKDVNKDVGCFGDDDNKLEATVTSTQTSEPVRATQASQAVSECSTQEVQAIAGQASQGSQASNQASLAVQASAASQASNLTCQGSQASAPLSNQGSQAALSQSNEEKGTQSGLPAVAVMNGSPSRQASRDDTFDLKEMHQQMCSLSKELCERKKETETIKRQYQEEREKAAQLDRVWQLKYQSLESKNEELHRKHNRMLNDYTHMKHSYESLKFDMDTARQARQARPVPETCAPGARVARGGPTQYPNPYAQHASPSGTPNASPPAPALETRFGNPYAPHPTSNSHDEDDGLPQGLMEMSVNSMTMDSLRYPPDTPLDDAALSDASDPLPPPLTALPEPLQPHILPEGKIAAIKLKMTDMNMVQPEHTEDDREDAQFVDAPEFPDEPQRDNAAMVEASAPPLTLDEQQLPSTETPPPSPLPSPQPQPSPQPILEPKQCPECVVQFPPLYPEEDFVRHVQRHFGKICPVCHQLLSVETNMERHIGVCMANK